MMLCTLGKSRHMHGQVEAFTVPFMGIYRDTSMKTTRWQLKGAKPDDVSTTSSSSSCDTNEQGRGSVVGGISSVCGDGHRGRYVGVTGRNGLPPVSYHRLHPWPLCWCFTYVTSIVTLEASWTVSQDSTMKGSGFLSMTQRTLGPVGEVVTALLFWFLLTSIVTTYTSEGGELISKLAQKQFIVDSGLSTGLSPTIGSALFMTFFAGLDFFGTERVDLVNRVLVIGLVTTFLGLLGIGLPRVDTSLLYRADWITVYPDVISVGILSLGAQNVVPTLLKYLGGDAERTKRAILFGSLTPLVMYTLWELVFLGIVPYDPSGSKMEIVSTLGTTGGAIVEELVKIFSACAIGSSMAGASVSLIDFFEDAIANLGRKDENKSEEKTASASRLVAISLALGPPSRDSVRLPRRLSRSTRKRGFTRRCITLRGATRIGPHPSSESVRRKCGQHDDAGTTKRRDSRSLCPRRSFHGISFV